MSKALADAARRGAPMIRHTKAGVLFGRNGSGELCGCFLAAAALGDGVVTLEEAQVSVRPFSGMMGNFCDKVFAGLFVRHPELAAPIKKEVFSLGLSEYANGIISLNDNLGLSIEEIAKRVEDGTVPIPTPDTDKI